MFPFRLVRNHQKINAVRIYHLLLCLCVGTHLSAQKVKIRSLIEPGSKLLDKTGNSTLEKTTAHTYIRKIYFPETVQKTHHVTYRDRECSVREGYYAEWWDDGQLHCEGQYLNGLQQGPWVFDRGKGLRRGNFERGKEEGRWLYLDSLGQVEIERYYQAGQLHGASKYYSGDTLLREELYLNGELAKVASVKPYVVTTDSSELVVEQLPLFGDCTDLSSEKRRRCSYRQLLRYIYRSIKYPPDARNNGIQGMAILSFVINKKGGIEDIVVKRGLCESIREECLRIVREMPAWEPGYQNGEPVRVHFRLPIKFKLE